MAISFFATKAQAPSASPTVASAAGTFSVATARQSQSGRTAISPVTANAEFPMTVTPQPYNDNDALVADHVLVSNDGGATWFLQSSSTIGEITLNSFDSGTVVSPDDSQVAGITSLDFGTFGPSDSPEQLIYIQNDSGSGNINFLEFNVFDPVSLDTALEYSGNVQFAVEGFLGNIAGNGTLDVTQNGNALWKNPAEGDTVIDFVVAADNFIKVRISLVNYPVNGFTEATVNLAVDITTSTSLRTVPNYFQWDQGTILYDPVRNFGYPILTVNGSDFQIEPTAVNLGGLAAVNPSTKVFSGLADGNYRAYVNAAGAFEVQLTSDNLPLSAIELGTFTVTATVPNTINPSVGVRSPFSSLTSGSAVDFARFVMINSSGDVEHADGTLPTIGVSLETQAASLPTTFGFNEFAILEVDAAYAAGVLLGLGANGIGTLNVNEPLAISITASAAANEYVLVKLLSGGGGGGGTDELVKASATDTTAGFLADKLTTNSTLTATITDPGADEKILVGVNLLPGVPNADFVGIWELEDATDSSGNGLTLTNNGPLSFVPAKVGNGVQNNGSVNQNLSRNTETLLEFGDKNYGLCGWVSPASFGFNNYVVRKDSGFSAEEFEWRITSTGYRVTLGNGAGNVTNYDGSTILPLDTFTHMVINVDAVSNNMDVYINGVLDQSFNIAAQALGVGPAPFLIAEQFDGIIDQVVKRDGLFTADEIAKIYNGGDGVLTIAESLQSVQFVAISGNDTTAGGLADKLTAGTNVTLTENNDGGSETLSISAADPTVIVSANDTTAGTLDAKVVAGEGTEVVVNNEGANESIAVNGYHIILDNILSSNITIVAPAATYTTIVFDSENLDLENIYNTTTGIFSPVTTGRYTIGCSLRLNVPTVGRHAFEIFNNTDAITEAVFEIWVASNLSLPGFFGSRSLVLDSTKDYLIRYIDVSGTGTQILTVGTFLEIFKEP
ncbi:putative cell surface protein [Acaryochloris phage A-HIS1]|nr:putative cell surface protein [Acaryochloris phage A-HIS1]